MVQTETPVRQAFGSPGGKTYLAPKIVGMIPPHDTYVEPFAGGAAVYFKKSPSEKEVLSDKDREIAFAFRFLRDMTSEQFERLQKKNWVITREQFEKLKGMTPKDDLEHFYKFYYLKKASYGDASKQINPLRLEEGHNHLDVSHLWKVHERLKRTAVHGRDAIGIIRKYDSPTALHFVDPPYPGRAFIGETEKYTEEDLARLVNVLKDIKGKFILTLGTEHANLLPKNWHIRKVKVWRRIPRGGGDFNRTFGYEIIATNYNPDTLLTRSSQSFKPPAIKRQISDAVLHRERRKVLIKTRRRPKKARRYNPSSVSLSRMG
jgi:DNA adenine methylase